MLSRCLLTKFLHRSSVGSLLRVRCWLGKFTVLHCTMDVAVERKNKNPLQKHFLSLLLSLSSLVDLFSPFPDSISNCLFFCRLRRLRYLWRAVTGIQFQPFLFFFFFFFCTTETFLEDTSFWQGWKLGWGGEREGRPVTQRLSKQIYYWVQASQLPRVRTIHFVKFNYLHLFPRLKQKKKIYLEIHAKRIHKSNKLFFSLSLSPDHSEKEKKEEKKLFSGILFS